MPANLIILWRRIAQWAAFFVFLGRAWQHLRWDAPYRSLLWDETLLRPLVEGWLGWSWREYVTSPASEAFISDWITITGWFYLICAAAVWTIGRFPQPSRILLILGGINLVFLAGLYYKEHFYFAGQFFEYALQWTSPFWVIALYQSERLTRKTILGMKIAIALTFTCHGLFAFGFYPRPGYFVQMTMNILSVENDAAIVFLRWAGILDFLVSIAIFLPARYSHYALAYAALWGLATTVARVWAHFYPERWLPVLEQWLHESLFRLPHFLIPLLLFLYYQQQRNTKERRPAGTTRDRTTA